MTTDHTQTSSVLPDTVVPHIEADLADTAADIAVDIVADKAADKAVESAADKVAETVAGRAADSTADSSAGVPWIESEPAEVRERVQEPVPVQAGSKAVHC